MDKYLVPRVKTKSTSLGERVDGQELSAKLYTSSEMDGGALTTVYKDSIAKHEEQTCQVPNSTMPYSVSDLPESLPCSGGKSNHIQNLEDQKVLTENETYINPQEKRIKMKLKLTMNQSTLNIKKLKTQKDASDVTSKLSIPMTPIRVLRAENFHCDYYSHFIARSAADKLLSDCEQNLSYFTGDLATVKLYGKSIPIPRKQVAYGEDGLTYTYSGVTVPARSWSTLPFLTDVRQKIEDVTGFKFNFVLINRYKDGKDSMGEHRDDEKDLDLNYPTASLSLGQHRDFIFRHKDARGKNKTRDVDPVKLELAHGSLLMMNPPTNDFWYHSLPRRANQTGVRINMTFRKILRQMQVK